MEQTTEQLNNRIIRLEQQVIDLNKQIKSLGNFSSIPLEVDKAFNARGFLKVETGLGDPLFETGTFTVTIASQAVFTSSKRHNLFSGQRLYLSTTGALPTGLTPVSVEYYVLSDGLTATQFKLSETEDGSPVATSGTQSGVHTFTTIGIVESAMVPVYWGKVIDRSGGNIPDYYIPLYVIGQS